MRCALCRKNVDHLTVHGLCEECDRKFDYLEPAKEEQADTAKFLARRIFITAACAVGLILFMIAAITLLSALI